MHGESKVVKLITGARDAGLRRVDPRACESHSDWMVEQDRRPLVAQHMRVVFGSLPMGRYDEARQLTVDSSGLPVAMTGRHGETATESRVDPADPAAPSLWLQLETATKVAREAPDDAMRWAETETRTTPDPADPASDGWLALAADDTITGPVTF